MLDDTRSAVTATLTTLRDRIARRLRELQAHNATMATQADARRVVLIDGPLQGCLMLALPTDMSVGIGDEGNCAMYHRVDAESFKWDGVIPQHLRDKGVRNRGA